MSHTLPEKPILVSIICNTYNHDQFISNALDGFLMQRTTFPFEVLIHDDASTDETAGIIRTYHAKYPDIIKPIYQTENQYSKEGGKTRIRKSQYGRACGKYIALCEGDDYWTDPHKLQKQVDFLEEHSECVICFHDVRVVYEDGSKESHNCLPAGYKEISTLADLLASNFIPTCSVMFKNGLIKEFPKWLDEVRSGDWALHVLNAQYGKIGYINNTMGIYRKHSKGIHSGADKFLRLESSLHGREVLYKNLNLNIKRKKILGEYIFRNSYFLAYKYYIKKNDAIRSKMYLAKCFQYIHYNTKISWRGFIKLCFVVWTPVIYKVFQAAKRNLMALQARADQS